MAITVAELVDVPFLKMRFHAGTAGGDRLITWAHTSDLPNATDWLAPGDLLMSNGLNLPGAAEGQVSFLDGLESAGLSGFAVGDDMHAPPFAPTLLERAEELAFPVLAIPREVPFAAISRAVASANSDEEHERLVQTVQLYEPLRGAVSSGSSGPALLRELGCRLLLLDGTTALPVLAAEADPPTGLVEHLVAELR